MFESRDMKLSGFRARNGLRSRLWRSLMVDGVFGTVFGKAVGGVVDTVFGTVFGKALEVEVVVTEVVVVDLVVVVWQGVGIVGIVGVGGGGVFGLSLVTTGIAVLILREVAVAAGTGRTTLLRTGRFADL